MPSTNAYPGPTAKTPALHLIAGRFTVNGASAPTILRGAGFTVSAPASGVYTVAYNDAPFFRIVACGAEMVGSSANNAGRAEVRSNNSNDLKIATQSAVGTDANLSSGQQVSFWVLLSETENEV